MFLIQNYLVPSVDTSPEAIKLYDQATWRLNVGTNYILATISMIMAVDQAVGTPKEQFRKRLKNPVFLFSILGATFCLLSAFLPKGIELWAVYGTLLGLFFSLVGLCIKPQHKTMEHTIVSYPAAESTPNTFLPSTVLNNQPSDITKECNMAIIKKEGGNGQVSINTESGIATKTLKPGKKGESKSRYKKEMLALQRIQKEQISNIVEIIDVNEKTGIISMKAYEGNLSEIYDTTRNNPQMCAKLLVPLVNALRRLSTLEIPIYHRDLKPANILYNIEDDEPVLYISDFGCCYFEQDDTRQTPSFRAVGAQSYRAPEYDYGRVEEITTKGDIYSIGKILWAMINGIKDEIFPYTLWFPDEYNLLKRFPQNSELTYANLIIARCVSINPDERPSYDQLLEMLNNISNPEVTVSAEKQLKVKLFSAKREHEVAETRELNRMMLILFHQDFGETVSKIAEDYSDLALLSHLKSEYEKTLKFRDYDIKHKITNDVASYIFSTSFDNIYFAVHYHPTYSYKNGNPDDKYASISLEYRISSNSESGKLLIAYKNKNLEAISNEKSTLFGVESIRTLMDEMVDKYIVSFD